MRNDNYLSMYQHEDQFNYLHSVATPPEEVPIELHSFFELYFFISGDLIFYVEGQAYNLKKGDILVINNDELHRVFPISSKPYERVVIHFNRRFMDGFSDGDYHLIDFLTKRKLGHANLVDSAKINTEPIYDFLKNIDAAINENSQYTHVMVKTYFIQLLVALSCLYSDKTDSIITPKHYDKRITDILKYINRNLDQKMTLKDLENRFFINKYYLCHVFKRNTGFTVFEYISNKRIMRAKQLLSQGMPVIDTCYAVGFSDYSNFYKVFKRVTGIPPKKFSRQN